MPVSPSPVPPTVYVPESGGKKLFSKRNILLMLFLLVMVGALPVGVYLTQKTQIFKSKAATADISGTFTFAPEMAVKDPNDTTGLQYVSRKRGLITMQIKSDADVEPFLTGAGATSIPTAVPAPAGTSTPAPSTTATPVPVSTPTATSTPVVAKPSAPSSTSSKCTTSANAAGYFDLELNWWPVADAEYYIVSYGLNETGAIYSTQKVENALNYKHIVNPGSYVWSVKACNTQGSANNCSDYINGNPVECK